MNPQALYFRLETAQTTRELALLLAKPGEPMPNLYGHIDLI